MVSSSGSANIATVKVEGKANYLFDHPFGLKRYPLPKSVLVEQVLIPTRDGINLAATLFRPRTADPVPAIVTATLYGKDNYNQWTYFQDPPEGNIPGGAFYMGDVTVSDHTAFEAPDPGFWVANGYAVMLVDLPGFGRSDQIPLLPGSGSTMGGHIRLGGETEMEYRQGRHERSFRPLLCAMDRCEGGRPFATESHRSLGRL